jgi:glycerol-3-phosphate cytidylyltransferase-like family protein
MSGLPTSGIGEAESPEVAATIVEATTKVLDVINTVPGTMKLRVITSVIVSMVTSQDDPEKKFADLVELSRAYILGFLNQGGGHA